MNIQKITDKEGTLQTIQKFDLKTKIFTVKKFSKNGNPYEICMYKKGKLHGKQISFHPNGKKAQILFYKNGKIHGKCFFFRKSGKIRSTYTFKHNKVTGPIAAYSKKGRILHSGYLVDNKLHGDSTFYYADGTVQKLITYRFNQKHGQMIEIGKNSLIKKFSIYKKNKIEGQVFHFHHNGTVSKKIMYRNGTPNGPYVYYDPLKNIIQYGNMIDGCKTGIIHIHDTQKFYHSNHILVQKTNQTDTCVVCLEQTSFYTPCRHPLCCHCAQKWYMVSSKVSCPYCRKKY